MRSSPSAQVEIVLVPPFSARRAEVVELIEFIDQSRRLKLTGVNPV
jgi:hypothetical protein